jgi:hypothetical protein
MANHQTNITINPRISTILINITNHSILTITILILSMASLSIFIIPNISAQSQDYSQGLSGQAYLDYTAKMAKELDDIDYGYEALMTNNKYFGDIYRYGYVEYLFPNLRNSFAEPKYPYAVSSRSQCSIAQPKNAIYYLYFSGMCDTQPNSRSIILGPLAQFAEKFSSIEILQADRSGYVDYSSIDSTYRRICSPRVEYKNSVINFIKKHDPKRHELQSKFSDRYIPTTQAEYEDYICVREFYKLYPGFVADKNECDTSDWLIFELGARTNPHCSIVDINDVPLKLKYYHTSWGLFKIGTKPDTAKDQRVNSVTRLEALADSDPEKTQDIVDRQRRERRENTVLTSQEALDEKRLYGIRTFYSDIIWSIPTVIYNALAWIGLWLLDRGLPLPIYYMISSYKFPIVYAILILAISIVYYLIRKSDSQYRNNKLG